MSNWGTPASRSGIAARVDPAITDSPATDLVPPHDVAGWRRAARKRLALLREELGQAGRAQASTSICDHLERVLAARGIKDGATLAGYWPIRHEPDLRMLLSKLHRAGVVIALPVVDIRAAPLVFRRWTPETRLQRGHWKIPVPPPEVETLVPDAVIAPCLGWDAACFRLGWGGGYFDRTLAVLAPPPFRIGVALDAARLPTIHPQPHDIPLDLIVTEEGVAAQRETST